MVQQGAEVGGEGENIVFAVGGAEGDTQPGFAPGDGGETDRRHINPAFQELFRPTGAFGFVAHGDGNDRAADVEAGERMMELLQVAGEAEPEVVAFLGEDDVDGRGGGGGERRGAGGGEEE